MRDDGRCNSFETTRWSLIARVKAGGEECQRALEELACRYRPAVRAFLQHRGLSPEEAEDATQDFFAEVVLKRGLFTIAEPGPQPRLRTLIRAALKRFQTDRYRRARAHGRGAARHVNLESCEAFVRDGAATDPEAAFDRQWAVVQVQHAMQRCEAHYRAKHMAAHWELFEALVVQPAIAHVSPPPVASLAAAHGFRTPADASAAAQTVRRRFRTLLLEVVAETTESPTEADDELRHLLEILGEG